MEPTWGPETKPAEPEPAEPNRTEPAEPELATGTDGTRPGLYKLMGLEPAETELATEPGRTD